MVFWLVFCLFVCCCFNYIEEGVQDHGCITKGKLKARREMRKEERKGDEEVMDGSGSF